MIRLFSKLCKCFNKISFENEINIFNRYMESINVDDLVCPFCKAKHELSSFASYKRHLVTYDGNKVHDNIIIISRYICSSCGHTHAILPPVIIPYLSFSFNFILSIIHDYLVGKFDSIEALCNHYETSISTFYRILKKFKEHKKLWLGLLEDKLNSNLALIQKLKTKTFLEIENFLMKFFNQNGLSFFQETS